MNQPEAVPDDSWRTWLSTGTTPAGPPCAYITAENLTEELRFGASLTEDRLREIVREELAKATLVFHKDGVRLSPGDRPASV